MKRLTIAFALLLALGSVGNSAARVSWAGEGPAGGGLAEEAQEHVDSIAEKRQALGELSSRLAGARGEDRLVLEGQIARKQMELVADIHALSENVLQQERKGGSAGGFRQQAEAALKSMTPYLRKGIQDLEASIAGLRSDREKASGDDLLRLQEEIGKEVSRLDATYKALVDHVGYLEKLGMDAASPRAFLAERLSARADALAGRIELSIDQIRSLEARLKDDKENGELKSELRAAQDRQQRTTASLSATVEMLSALGQQTAAYKQLLIRATGEITGDILDAEVALGLFQQWMGNLRGWAVDNGPRVFFKVLVFLLIIAVFKILARFTGKLVHMSVSTSKLQFSQLLQNMFISVASKTVMILGILVALSQLGVQLAPLLAGLGVAGFIIGFALQETLSNFAAGLMILVYRPFDLGDLVEAGGAFGKVNHMSLVSTTILTVDNQTLVVPNSKIWGDVIKNVTAQRVRRVDMVFGISYSDDIERAEEVLKGILSEHDKVLESPEPVVRLHALGESSVDFIVRPWVNTADYWDVYWDVTREVKMRFDREDISIPFPQRDVHFYREETAGGVVNG